MRRRTFLRTGAAAALATALPHRRALAAAYRPLTQVPPDLDAVTGDGGEVVLRGRDVQALSQSLRGSVLLADDEGYDSARRVLNPSFDKYPALVVQPTGAADVQRTVEFAAAHDLLTAVKCGGHSFSGKSTCDRGLLIDLSTFRGVRVDRATRRGRIAGGSLLGELDHESMAHGLVTPMGTVSHTGVGGLATGGGFGRLARRYGLSLDNMTTVDVVAADGKLYQASAEENEDLFWAVRGGGGNFGVVTSFEFQLHPMQRDVVGGAILYPLSMMRDVLERYREYHERAPDELYMDFLGIQAPGGDPPVTGFSVCYSGPENQAEAVLAPLRSLGDPLVDTVARMDYVAQQRSGDIDDPRAQGQYLTGGFIAELPDGLIDGLVDGFKGDPRRATVVFFQHSGGAINRIPNEATAFPHRYAMANVGINTGWPFGAEADAHMDYARQYWRSIQQYGDGFYTVDVPPDTTAEGINRNYRGNYDRLVTIKNRYDPGNLFRLNTNVEPRA
ncbi:MAG: FAD-binding oxidoreductase [Gemmatimonadetes bacterium]|nr:FAD-binding oxidoreductase [Gemmatimonadota bacterium]